MFNQILQFYYLIIKEIYNCSTVNCTTVILRFFLKITSNLFVI